MNLSSKFMPTIDFFKQIMKLLLDFSKSSFVELWLKIDGGNDAFRLIRITDKSFNVKNISTVKDKNNYCDKEHNFIDILKKIFKKKSFSAGSIKNDYILWTGSIQKMLIDIYKSNGIKKKWKKSCAFFKNYNSIVLIPLNVGQSQRGFILLISEKENYFKSSGMKFYKDLSLDLGLIISNQQAQAELHERIKELTCLYGIANASEDYDTPLNDIIEKTLMLLKSAWQYPEITQARIILDGKTFCTPGYKKEVDKQCADIIINDVIKGTVEVSYTKKKILLDEGPFLYEERNLINTIAKEISLIAERKYSEINKKNLEEQLRHADRLATIGQLSSGVAHELNEPLCSILGFVQLIQKDKDLNEKTKKDLEKILNASIHAREIVRKLLIFARQMPTKKTRVNINQLINEELFLVKSRCEKENIDLELFLDEAIPDIIIDPSQLTQILINLAVNSIQAMTNGGKLKIITAMDDDHIDLTVEDNGIGMDENTLKQIFIPFFTTKDVGQGTGLGLPVVHGIVSSYNGTINIDSKIGIGTKFEIKLPLSELDLMEDKFK